MNDTKPPSLSSSGRGRSGDDLDGLLSEFFQGQMPNPWPTLTVPESNAQPSVASPQNEERRKGGSLWKSRALALAASVAIVLIAPLLLPGDSAPSGPALPVPGHNFNMKEAGATRPQISDVHIDAREPGKPTPLKMTIKGVKLP